MNTTKRAGYSYDALTNTLTVTKTFMKKASQYGTAEYNIIKGLRGDNPNMKFDIIERTATKSEERPVTAKYADMEHFIKQFPQERQDSLMERYKKVKALSKTHRSPYKFVLDWFLDYFPLYNTEAAFDENGNLTSLKTKDDLEQEKLEAEMKAALEAAKETAADLENIA